MLVCYRPPAASGRRRCRCPLAPGPGPTATRVGLWTATRPGRPVGNPRVLLPNSSRSLRDRREGRKKQGHRLWQQDKRMTRPSCPLAAPHFAPASSTRFPPQCPCHVKPTARQARVAARDPIIVLHCEPPPLVPPPGSSPCCRAPGSPFLFASSPVHTSPHVTPHFRSSSHRGITRFHLQTPALLLAPSPLRFFPRATYLDHDLPRSCACALPEL